jgi:hypothetical protein
VNTVVRRAELAAWIGLSGIGLGLAVLLVYAWVEFLNNPGISLVDGYWIGRVPWTPLGVILVLAGSVLAVLAAATLVILRGDWVRWVVLLPILGAPILWWLLALRAIPFARYDEVDPVSFAYSVPEVAAVLLILPALLGAALAFLPMRPDRRVLFNRVHPAEPTYRWPTDRPQGS